MDENLLCRPPAVLRKYHEKIAKKLFKELLNNMWKVLPKEGLFFTALHGMQMRSSDQNSVCPSVRLSNAWIVTKRKKDLSRFLCHTKDHFA